MRELNLPIVKEFTPNKKILSMDEYLRFVQFNLQHTFDTKSYEKWKKMLVVNVRFSIS